MGAAGQAAYLYGGRSLASADRREPTPGYTSSRPGLHERRREINIFASVPLGGGPASPSQMPRPTAPGSQQHTSHRRSMRVHRAADRPRRSRA